MHQACLHEWAEPLTYTYISLLGWLTPMPLLELVGARSQLIRSGTTLAWAYHAARQYGPLLALPEELDVHAHVVVAAGDSRRQQLLEQLKLHDHVGELRGLGLPLTIHFKWTM